MNHLLPEVFPLTPHPETDTIIRKYLEKAHNKLRNVSGSGCLPHDIGLFLSQSVQVLDLLADGLVEGKHMKANTRVAIQQLESENDLSEIESLDSLIETHAIVRKIRERIHKATVEIQLLWDEVPPPPPSNDIPIGVEKTSSSSNQTSAPIPLYSAEEMPFTGMSASETPNNISQYPTSSQTQDSVQAEDVTFVDREIQPDDQMGNLDQLLESLKSRGSGTYTCPYGADCRKGAVGEDGELVVFTRNSEFRAHVEKHIKRYKCNLPNCPTRKGFSRPDQLRRHQETVSHVPQY